VHLLTAEAFETYLKHLKPTGVLAVHISNRFVDLAPVVVGAAAHFDLGVAVIAAEDEDREEWSASTWVLLTRDREFLSRPAIRDATAEPEAEPPPARLWTDDFSDVVSLLK
jgi:hypothetical protein